jgi:hypothetical protein
LREKQQNGKSAGELTRHCAEYVLVSATLSSDYCHHPRGAGMLSPALAGGADLPTLKSIAQLGQGWIRPSVRVAAALSDAGEGDEIEICRHFHTAIIETMFRALLGWLSQGQSQEPSELAGFAQQRGLSSGGEGFCFTASIAHPSRR